MHYMRGSRVRGEAGVRTDPECRGRGQDRTPPPGKSQNYRVPSNTGLDPLKITKLPGASIRCWTDIDRQQNAIEIAFRWWADGGSL